MAKPEIKYIIKHMLMIEDKLFNNGKRCTKCIFEHILLVEGLVETLMKEKTNKVYPALVNIPSKLRDIQILLRNKKPDFTKATQDLRAMRKEIAKTFFEKPEKYTTAKIERVIKHKCNRSILPVLDPLFNLREVLKNIMLIKDHLLIKEHRCNQCHKKHSLLIEAFLEEASTLDKTGQYVKLINDMLRRARKVQRFIQIGREKYTDALKELNYMEKKIFPYGIELLDKIDR